MIAYFGTDVKRIHHALKVYGFTMAIAHSEGADPHTVEVLELAAALHDIGIKEAERKYNSSAGIYQEKEGPAVARTIMEALNIAQELADRVCYLVGNHHSYEKIDGPDFQILIEADMLVNIQEDGLSGKAVSALRAKCFKTAAGKSILEGMYPI